MASLPCRSSNYYHDAHDGESTDYGQPSAFHPAKNNRLDCRRCNVPGSNWDDRYLEWIGLRLTLAHTE